MTFPTFLSLFRVTFKYINHLCVFLIRKLITIFLVLFFEIIKLLYQSSLLFSPFTHFNMPHLFSSQHMVPFFINWCYIHINICIFYINKISGLTTWDKLDLREEIFRTNLAWVLWVLCPKYMVSSTIGSYLPCLGNNQRQQQ